MAKAKSGRESGTIMTRFPGVQLKKESKKEQKKKARKQEGQIVKKTQGHCPIRNPDRNM